MSFDGSGGKMSTWYLVAAVVIAVTLAVWAYEQSRAASDGGPMRAHERVILVWYLLALGPSLAYALVTLYRVDIPEVALARAEAMPSELPAEGPAITRIVPLPTTDESSPKVRLALYGERLKGSKVRLDSRVALATATTDELVMVPLDLASVAGRTSLALDAKGADGPPSNVVDVPLLRPVGAWKPLGAAWLVTREVQLLLIVVLAGALGAYAHAVKSLADYIGNGTLLGSWFWWYVTRPFLGMALALVFYAVLRGGFLAGTAADPKSVNAFGVFAIAALVGMFSDQAAQKLGDVFGTMFTTQDVRGGKLGAAAVTRIVPASVWLGAKKPIVLTMIGERLGKTTRVRVGSTDRKPDSVAEKEVKVKLAPEDIANAGDLGVAVIADDGSASGSANLRIREPELSAKATAGEVGKAYEQPVTAAGGVAPLQWSLAGASPGWLRVERIDDSHAALRGTPTKADDLKVTVLVVDDTGAQGSIVVAVKVA